MVIYCLQFLGFVGGSELERGWIYKWKAHEQGVTWDRTAQPSTFCVMDVFGAPFTVIFHFDFCLQFRFNLYPSEKVSWAELLILFSCCLMCPHPWKNEGMWLSSLKNNQEGRRVVCAFVFRASLSFSWYKELCATYWRLLLLESCGCGLASNQGCRSQIGDVIFKI